MNEQLIVKNFGPIKDATVDFKRVTVFIGPTGGGKSTLAKLAAVFRDKYWPRQQTIESKREVFDSLLNKFLILDYLKDDGEIHWYSSEDSASYNAEGVKHDDSRRRQLFINGHNTFNRIAAHLTIPEPSFVFELATEDERLAMNAMNGSVTEVYYVPADRAFAAALESGLAGLILKGIALPEALLTFLNEFKLAQNNLQLTPLEIPFLDISYRIVNKQARVDLGNDGVIELNRGASGIQAVIPMMLVINYNNRRHNRQSIPLSFIIEEPELNLYPTAQQGLLNWLVEKCTKGENDLTITTHSPYILSHLNLLLYAYQVAEKHPDRREAVAAIVPEASWINPKEFACYQVENGGVESLVNEDLGLIDDNGLDNLSGDAADAFDNLIRLSKGFARK